MANVIIDQFGSDVSIRPVDDDTFRVKIDVVVSAQFLSWVIALEGKVQIEGPDSVKEKMNELLKKKYVV